MTAIQPTELTELLNQQGEPGMRFIAIEPRSEPATPDEQMEAETGREVEWLGTGPNWDLGSPDWFDGSDNSLKGGLYEAGFGEDGRL